MRVSPSDGDLEGGGPKVSRDVLVCYESRREGIDHMCLGIRRMGMELRGMYLDGKSRGRVPPYRPSTDFIALSTGVIGDFFLVLLHPKHVRMGDGRMASIGGAIPEEWIPG